MFSWWKWYPIGYHTTRDSGANVWCFYIWWFRDVFCYCYVSLSNEDVPLKLDAEKKKLEETLEKQVEWSLETPVKASQSYRATEPVELETNIQEMKEHVKLEDDIHLQKSV